MNLNSRSNSRDLIPNSSSHFQKNNPTTPGFSVIGKKGKVLKNTIKNTINPLSPSFQQINEKPPILNTSCSAFNFNDVTINMPDPNLTLVDNQFNEHTSDVSLSSDNTPTSLLSNTDIEMYTNNNYNNILLRFFRSDYIGPIFVLAECIDQNKNMGNRHPISAAKFFSSNFMGITNIKSAGSKKVNITFNTISPMVTTV